MTPRWYRAAMLALFLCAFIAGHFWSASAHKPPQPSPSAPLPVLKPDPAATWNALAAEEERLARALRLEAGR